MKGTSHAASGALAGVTTAPWVSDLPAVQVGYAVATAGAALLPDLDAPKSAASTLVPAVTPALHRLLAGASARLYRATAGPRDEPWTGRHRHMTHTAAFALVAGGITTVGSLASPWVALGIYALVVLLAANRLGDWALLVGLAGGGALADQQLLGDPTAVAGPLGLAVAVGCLTHDLGDACTPMGCPIAWPLLIAGETFYELRLLGPLSFRTDGAIENRLVTPLLTVAAAAAVVLVWLEPGSLT